MHKVNVKFCYFNRMGLIMLSILKVHLMQIQKRWELFQIILQM